MVCRKCHAFVVVASNDRINVNMKERWNFDKCFALTKKCGYVSIEKIGLILLMFNEKSDFRNGVVMHRVNF